MTNKTTQKNGVEKIAKSGFYRFWLEIDNSEWSYIGISKNIAKRIQTHFSNIKKFYQLGSFHTDFIAFLANQGLTTDEFAMPASGALYYKTTLMCYLHDKKPADFKWEVLKATEIDLYASQEEEMAFIAKYHSEKHGFNGPFAKEFQINNTLRNSYSKPSLEQEKLLEHFLSLQNVQNIKLKKELEQLKEVDYHNYTFWLGFQMGVMMNNDGLRKKFTKYYFDNLTLVRRKMREAYRLREKKKIFLNRVKKWTPDLKCSYCSKGISNESYEEIRFANALSKKEFFLCQKCCMKKSLLKKFLSIQHFVTK